VELSEVYLLLLAAGLLLDFGAVGGEIWLAMSLDSLDRALKQKVGGFWM
jgi:hypothetical protein